MQTLDSNTKPFSRQHITVNLSELFTKFSRELLFTLLLLNKILWSLQRLKCLPYLLLTCESITFLCAYTVSSFPPFRVSSGWHKSLLLSTNSVKMPLKSQTAFSLTPSLSRHASVRRLPRPQIAAMWAILPRHLVGSTPTSSISGYLHSRKTFPPFRVSSVLVTFYSSPHFFISWAIRA